MTKKKTGLGKGLDSLIGMGSIGKPVQNTATSEGSKVIKEVIPEEERILKVKLRDIDPRKDQPRTVFEEEKMEELTESVRRMGVITPLIVEKVGRRYRIVAGERRWRAAKAAGLKEVPVMIKKDTEERIEEIALIDNLQRENLNPVEEAKAFRQIMEKQNLTQEKLSEVISRSRSSIANSLRLLQLPPSVLSLLEEGELSVGHAKCLLSLPEGDREEVAGILVEKGLSIRETEDFILKWKKSKEAPERVPAPLPSVHPYQEVEKMLMDRTGSKVKIKVTGSDKGKLEFSFHSSEELDHLIGLISRKEED